MTRGISSGELQSQIDQVGNHLAVEIDQFGEGTKALSLAIAESDGFSIAGGGDTLAAIGKYDIEDKVSYISTGGGAFLEYVEGKKLPAVAALEQAAKL